MVVFRKIIDSFRWLSKKYCKSHASEMLLGGKTGLSGGGFSAGEKSYNDCIEFQPAFKIINAETNFNIYFCLFTDSKHKQ